MSHSTSIRNNPKRKLKFLGIIDDIQEFKLAVRNTWELRVFVIRPVVLYGLKCWDMKGINERHAKIYRDANDKMDA